MTIKGSQSPATPASSKKKKKSEKTPEQTLGKKSPKNRNETNTPINKVTETGDISTPQTKSGKMRKKDVKTPPSISSTWADTPVRLATDSPDDSLTPISGNKHKRQSSVGESGKASKRDKKVKKHKVDLDPDSETNVEQDAEKSQKKKNKKKKKDKKEEQTQNSPGKKRKNSEDATISPTAKKSKKEIGKKSDGKKKTTETQAPLWSGVDRTKLLVSGLSKTTTEDEISAHFPHAHKAYIHRRKKDKMNAVIEYKTEAGAKRAMEENTDAEINGHKITLNYLVKENYQKTTEKKTLYVGNLPAEVSEGQVRSHFPGAVSVRLRSIKKGTQFAFVEFPSRAEAEVTREEKDGASIWEREIKVDFVSSTLSQPVNKEKTLVLTNLSDSTSQADLIRVFNEAVSISFPKQGGKRVKGTAHVVYRTAGEVKSLISQKRSLRLHGKRVKLARIVNAQKKVKSKEKYLRTLCVNNVHCSPSELKSHFLGAVHVKIPQSKDGKSKHIAFVEFRSEAEVDANISKKQGSKLGGKTLQLSYLGTRRKRDNCTPGET